MWIFWKESLVVDIAVPVPVRIHVLILNCGCSSCIILLFKLLKIDGGFPSSEAPEIAYYSPSFRCNLLVYLQQKIDPISWF